MNSLLRSLVPPIVMDARRKLRPSCPAFGSYLAALNSCSTGYNADQIAEVVVQKTLRHRADLATGAAVSDMRTVTLALAVRTAAGETLNCLDFGGAAGAHYLQVKQLFGDAIKIRWHVVETASMVAMASRAMTGDELAFFADIESAAAAFPGPVDLVLSSGTLQYTPDPVAAVHRLCAVGAAHMLITRTALADVPLEKRSIVQTCRLSENGPGPMPAGLVDGVVQYPVTFADRAAVEQSLVERYSIDMRFSEDRGVYMIGAQPVSMYGYLASRRLGG